MKRINSLALGVAVSSSALVSLSNPVAAETAVNAPEEITITARKRSESLSDVPAAVTALDRQALDELGVADLSDISAFAPNLTIVAGSAQSNAASIFIRGIGQRDSLQTFEQGVGMYVDGVYLSRMQGSMMRLFDVERIEVLRGPQGALYGKNTIGGAINIITRDPFDGGGNAEIEYGAYDQKTAALYAAFPIAGDTAALSLAARYSNRDGFYKDAFTGTDYYDDNVFSGRLKLALKPSDDVRLTLAADLMDIDVGQYLGRAEDHLYVIDLALGPTVVREAPGPFDGETLASSIDAENGQTNTHWGLSLTAEWNLSDAYSLKSITSYRHMNPVQWLDADGSEFEIGDVWATWVHEQVSQEVQLSITREKWDAILGAFYMTEKSVAVQETFLNGYILVGGAQIGFSQPGHDTQHVDNMALFGHANIELSDAWTVSLGARWSRDEKDFERVSETMTGGVITGVFEFEGSGAWDAFTPSVTVDYRLTEDSHLYARIARGFRSGGFNGRMFSAADSEPFKPEYVWSYEVGFKGRTMDGVLSYGLTGFYNDYTDYQARVAVAIDSSDQSAGFNFPTINAAKLEMYGAEAELRANLDAWTLWGNIGLLGASYKEFRDDQRDRTGQEPIRTPDVTLSAGAVYHLTLGTRGSVDIGADVRYVSDYYTSVDNSDLLYEDGYWLVGANARWVDAADKWSVRAGVKNLFDTIYQVDAFEFRTLGNVQTGFYGEPRTWYVALGRAF
ncbi:TonB-dependent receptor [Kordiimonas lacus]|uniref:Iron complex outermembrane recepter protein n=1 Tax=Kordiimonas lacus TaxID=637679 RepID=A0A1G7BC94_9PROT|nr:TonB-dependent receptor [Kordiimonas lacus]SDE24537.1 iron complex outermembrane recepter protein [Kordiimonas lacus]